MKATVLVSLLFLTVSTICLPIPEADKPKDGGVIINVHGGPIHHVRADRSGFDEVGEASVDYFGRAAYGIGKRNGKPVRDPGPPRVLYAHAVNWPVGPSIKSKRDSLSNTGDSPDGWGADWPDGVKRTAADEPPNGNIIRSPLRRSQENDQRAPVARDKRAFGRDNSQATDPAGWSRNLERRDDLGPDNLQGKSINRNRGDDPPPPDPQSCTKRLAGWCRRLKPRGDLGPDNVQKTPGNNR